jgi:hypothetical protein
MITTHWRRAILYVMMTLAILILKSPYCQPRKLLLSIARQKSTTPSAQSKSTFVATGKTIEFAERVIGEYFPNSTHPTPEDIEVIEQRQIGRSAHSMFAVEKSKCKYGFPQAFVQYPVSTAISSGMIRLACPHLVKGIDELEAEGGLDLFDAKLADENEDGVLRRTFDQANKAWRTIRDVTVNSEDRKHMDSKLGVEGAAFLMDSGLIGCTIGKLQVKCLHAHVADHLMRGSNEIGAEALKLLDDRGKRHSRD